MLSASSLLAAAGKMALTNYFAQTVLCHFLFESYGFGMWNRWDWSGQLVVCMAIWTIEISWSVAWLRIFRFGPIEWVWRAATYDVRPLMLRARRLAVSLAPV